MSNYQTGDLLLTNQWTVGSILNHAFDTASQWSDVGILFVDRPGISDKSNYGPNNGYAEKTPVAGAKTDDGVRVVMMTTSGVKVLTIDELLRIPSLQAAAHRPLAVQNRKDVQRTMASYIFNIIQTANSDPKRIASNPFPPGLRDLLSDTMSSQSKSSHGTLLDEKGRDVKVSGFVKGNPNSQLKSDFTTADLIGSILAQAELIHYDPEIKISDFQQGGRLDDLYGDEVQLFARKPAEDVRQYILQKARQDAELLVLQYLERMPATSFDRYRSTSRFPAPRSEQYVQGEHGEAEDDNSGDDEFGTGYPDQNLAVYSTASVKERRGNTNAIALGVESETIDKKIRQRIEDAEKYSRPSPSYRKK